MRILITGASGLVGLNLALEAAGRGLQEKHQADGSSLQSSTGRPEGNGAHVVYGTTHQHALETEAFHAVHVDLLQPGELERLLDKTNPDWVINCAALAIVDACEENPHLAYRMNTELPAKLASLVARGGARLVHLSTDAVFDGERGEYTEDDRPNPLSVYARTKLEGERAVAEANPGALIARVNLFGWSLSGKRSLAEWFFYNLQDGRQLMGFTDVYFCPLLVNDLARVLLKMLSLHLSGLYHVVSSECSSKYNFGVALAHLFGLDASQIKPASIDQASLRASRSPNLTLRTVKLSRDLREPLPGLADGLDRFYKLFQQGYPQYLKSLGQV
jgi:dTDP-4-dehydrorhamnose reductase